MTRKIKTRDVEKGMYVNYLQKGEENLQSAQNALEKKAYNSAALNAVHAAISSADAYCVYGLKKRCASENHKDTATLIGEVQARPGLSEEIKKLFESIIRIKNMAEYEERLVRQKEAEKAVKEAGELFNLVKGELK
jgi:uncharacterized protein (UPF0332 family)